MNIIGHKKIVDRLHRSINGDSLAQAYVFSGPEGVGKFTVALDFANQVVSATQDKTSQDISLIEPEVEEKKGVIKKKDIKIEAIRELQRQLSRSSFAGGYKLAIINDADRLNRSAQNALLKTLEEPNEKIILILVAHNEKRLLPTILSRCQKIRFGLVDRGQLAAFVPEGARDKDKLLFWSLGRPGFLVRMLEDQGEVKSKMEVVAEFNGLFRNSLVEKFYFAEEMSKDSQMLIAKMELWLVILREALLGNHKITDISQEKAMYLHGRIGEAMEVIKNTNANARLALENLLIDF
jgi:DNA polymerase-3 subunit delta'